MEKIIGRKTGILYEVNKMEEMLSEKTVRIEFDEADYVWKNYQPEGIKSFRLVKHGQKINVELVNLLSFAEIYQICQPVSTKGWLKKYRCEESKIEKMMQGSRVESWGAETFYLRE
jgi:hypothetical protein